MTKFSDDRVPSHDDIKNDTYASIDTIVRTNSYMDLAQRSNQDNPYFPIIDRNPYSQPEQLDEQELKNLDHDYDSLNSSTDYENTMSE